MRLQRHALMGALATTLLIVAGCATVSLRVPAAHAPDYPNLSLYPNRSGFGTIALQVIDQRQGRMAQAVTDADTWDRVNIRLTSATTLRHDATASLIPATSRQATYSTSALGLIPPASDYQLLVSLATGSVILGQGASDSITVGAGQVASVSIVINSVGNINFFNGDYFTLTSNATGTVGFPELLEQSKIWVSPNLQNDPLAPSYARADRYNLELRNLGGTLIASSAITTASSQDITLPAAASLQEVKNVTVIGYNSSNQVVTTKMRPIVLLKGAGLNAILN